MIKKLNRPSTGQLVLTGLHAKMQPSYFEYALKYAMSAIAGRALPNVRNRLNPSLWD